MKNFWITFLVCWVIIYSLMTVHDLFNEVDQLQAISHQQTVAIEQLNTRVTHLTDPATVASQLDKYMAEQWEGRKR